MTFDLGTALLLGLLGSGHCLFMCGGLISALTMGKKTQDAWVLIAASSLGRLLSYACLGALMGALFNFIGHHQTHLQMALRSVGGLFLVFMGLYIGKWYFGIRKIEQWLSRPWRWLQNLIHLKLPPQNRQGSFIFGLFWGWLPCGLVYSTLAWASTVSTHALESALLMLTFGIGTLPAVCLTGYLAQKLAALLKMELTARVLGAIIIVLGLWTTIAPWLMPNHHH